MVTFCACITIESYDQFITEMIHQCNNRKFAFIIFWAPVSVCVCAALVWENETQNLHIFHPLCLLRVNKSLLQWMTSFPFLRIEVVEFAHEEKKGKYWQITIEKWFFFHFSHHNVKNLNSNCRFVSVYRQIIIHGWDHMITLLVMAHAIRVSTLNICRLLV